MQSSQALPALCKGEAAPVQSPESIRDQPQGAEHAEAGGRIGGDLCNLEFPRLCSKGFPKPRLLGPGPIPLPKNKVNKILTFKSGSLCQV